MSKKIIVFLLIFSFSFSSLASDVQGVKILRLMVDTVHGDKLFVKIDKVAEDVPDCSTNGTWQYVLPLSGELQKDTITSFLLSAYMGELNIRIKGTSACDVYGSIETLSRVEFIR